MTVTTEQFDTAMTELLGEMSPSAILRIPGVYESVSENLINFIIDRAPESAPPLPQGLMRSPYKDEAYRKAAHTRYEREGEVEIDPGAPVSHGDDDGAYVQAWVWIYTDEARCYE